jgi:pimeloyl-ACP methyl ester carboxylesterase
MAEDRTVDAPPTTLEPVREFDVAGAAGITLHAREWGQPDGPAILFVHGWSQCDLCWRAQLAGPLANRFRIVTFDMRGHGLSEKPLDPERYLDEKLWADDLAAVIDQTGLHRPVLVAWSYGGFVVTDYVRAHGDSDIGGIDLVGGAILLQPPSFAHLGPGLLENATDACLPDLGVNIAAIQRFLRACTAQPLDEDLWTAALCWNMIVPPAVRGALIAREIDGADALSKLSVPVLLTHGRDDRIVLPSMAEYAQQRCPSATISWYDGVGHMPFVEDAPRFDAELAAFVERASREHAITRGSR